MKEDTIITLGLIGVGGYLVYKSNILQGLGQASAGIGEGVEGIGEGVSSAFVDTGQAIGDISGYISGATENILNLLSPLGALGTAVSRNIENTSGNKQTIREGVFDQTKDVLIDIQATSDINTASEKSLRKAERQDFYTDTQSAAINTIETYNPKNILSNFVQSIKKVVQNISPTDAAISGRSSNSTLKTYSTGNTGVTYNINTSQGLGLSSSDQKILTSLGVPLMSTASGVIPAYTATPKKTSKLRTFLQNIF